MSAISFEGHVAAAQTTLALQSAAPTGTSGFVAEDPQMQQSSFERGDIGVTGKSVRKTCELCQSITVASNEHILTSFCRWSNRSSSLVDKIELTVFVKNVFKDHESALLLNSSL
ncbi:hypothetical protein [Novosphingobium sp.]|uniref:hypothetical protein n=1 Tax=Novosphingobium sp. TaxID=1874826 RepID=UPI0028AF76E3|nr:hypothetical protein [Novosphingobium sp.]